MRMRNATVVTVALALTATFAPAASAQDDWGNIDWKQFEGESLNVLATAMPVSEVYEGVIGQFEELTGISVNFQMMNDTDRKNTQLLDFQGGTGDWDVSNVGISNREEFVGSDSLEPLQPFLDDPALTDAAWYDMSDYADGVIGGGYTGGDMEAGTLVYLPFTAEYFLLWYRKDIFDELGLTAPTNIDELYEVAEATRGRAPGRHHRAVRLDRPCHARWRRGWLEPVHHGQPHEQAVDRLPQQAEPAARARRARGDGHLHRPHHQVRAPRCRQLDVAGHQQGLLAGSDRR